MGRQCCRKYPGLQWVTGYEIPRPKKKKKENFIPGYIIGSVVCKTREVIILLYLLPVRA